MKKLFRCVYCLWEIHISLWKTDGKFQTVGVLLGCCTLQLVYQTHLKPQIMLLLLSPWHNNLTRKSWFLQPFWLTHADRHAPAVWTGHFLLQMHSDWLGVTNKATKTISMASAALFLSCRINAIHFVNENNNVLLCGSTSPAVLEAVIVVLWPWCCAPWPHLSSNCWKCATPPFPSISHRCSILASCSCFLVFVSPFWSSSPSRSPVFGWLSHPVILIGGCQRPWPWWNHFQIVFGLQTMLNIFAPTLSNLFSVITKFHLIVVFPSQVGATLK